MEEIKEIKYVKEQLRPEDVIECPSERFTEMITNAYKEALRTGIEANSVLINKNMVRVPSFPFSALGKYGMRFAPDMICGLNVYWTENELPENYSFAVFKGPENRLAQFESIGMEPDELRKAAEIYRKIKEVEGCQL